MGLTAVLVKRVKRNFGYSKPAEYTMKTVEIKYTTSLNFSGAQIVNKDV